MNSSLVHCPQCGAPHARPSIVTRFGCDFCGASIQVNEGPKHEELVCPSSWVSAQADETMRRELALRGVRDFELVCGDPHWVAVWQVTSADGEEELRPADARASALLRRVGLPALPLVDRERADEDFHLPESPLDAATVQDAAREFFEDAQKEAAHLRLIWFRVSEVEVRSTKSVHTGLYIVGMDRLYMPDLERVHGVGPTDRALVWRYGVFLAASVLLAGLPLSVAWRGVWLAGLTLAALALERGFTGREATR